MKTAVLNSLAMALLAALVAHPLAAAEPSPDGAILSPVEETRPADANQEKIQGIREKIASQTRALELLTDEITQLNANVEKAQNEERAMLRDQRRRKH